MPGRVRRPPPPAQRADGPYRTAAGVTVVVLAVLVAAAALLALRTLITMLLVAGVLAAALNRPVAFIESRLPGRRRGLAVAVVMLICLILAGVVAFLLYQPFAHQSEVLRRGLPSRVTRLTQLPLIGRYLDPAVLATATSDFLRGLPELLRSHRGFLLVAAENAVTKFALAVTTATMTIFLLLKGPAMGCRAVELFVDNRLREWASRTGSRVLERVSGYVLGKLLTAFLAALVVAVALSALRVPFIPVLVVVMFLLDLIPLVGATLGGAVVGAAAFVLDPQPWKALLFVGIFTVYQLVESHTLYPLVMGRSAKVGAFGAFILTLAGAELSGIVGALLAIPVGAALHALAEDFLEERRRRAPVSATGDRELHRDRRAFPGQARDPDGSSQRLDPVLQANESRPG